MPTDATMVAARPLVKIDGSDVAGLIDGLDLLRVHEGADGVATLELRAGNWGATDDGQQLDFRFFDRSKVEFGKEIEIRHGDAALFAGRVTAIEGWYGGGAPPAVVVLAEDGLQDLRLTRRTRSFTDVSDADLVQRIAGDHGLQAQADITGPTHKQVAQLNQTDLAFLRARVRRAGGELWVRDGKLHAAPRTARAGGGDPPTLALGGELRELRIRADLAHQATSVRVQGWDVAGKQTIDEEAAASELSSEAGALESGPSILDTAFGARVQTVVATVPQTGAEAKAHAGALLRARARRFVTGRAVCETAPGLRPGAKVRLAGVGPLFGGDYTIVEAVHRFDGLDGMRTELAVERPGVGRP